MSAATARSGSGAYVAGKSKNHIGYFELDEGATVF
jgi:hypothetical protein